MAENNPPEPPDDDRMKELLRGAFLGAMKDYDRERSEWENAVKEKEGETKPPENPPARRRGLGEFLLGSSGD